MTPKALRQGLTGGVMVLVVLLGTASPALSHPYFLRSQPPPSSVVFASPAEIDITYTEILDYPYCRVVLVAPDGRHIATHQIHAGGSSQLAVALDHPLGQGTYAVLWTAVGGDGHTVTGGYGLSVGHPSSNASVPVSMVASAGTAGDRGAVVDVLRVLLPLSTVTLAGLFLLAGATAAAAEGDRRVGRRVASARWVIWGLLTTVIVGLIVHAILGQGLSAFTTAATGRRLLLQLALAAAALPLVAGSRRPRNRGLVRSASVVVATAQVVVLAASGHASTQPGSRRWIVLGVYSLHLLAVSIWIGAISAMVLSLHRTDPHAPTINMSKLRTLVGASIIAVIVTGLLDTGWAMRGLSQLAVTLYGRLVLTKLALYVVMVVMGVVAAVSLRQRRRRQLLIGEAIVSVTVLVLAGTLGQVSQPLEVPFASQLNAGNAGLPVSVGPAGDALVTGQVIPGIVGHNRIVVDVTRADINDFPHPVTGTEGVSLRLECGCSAPVQAVTLQPVAGTPSWATDLDLPVAATWSLTAAVHLKGEAAPRLAQLSAPIERPSLPGQVIVGVAADLSGPNRRRCTDQVLGLEAALVDVNQRALDHGRLVRVVAVDVRDGVTAAMNELQPFHPVALALPCGTSNQVSDIVDQARRWQVPVVAANTVSSAGGVWSLGPDWGSEGRLIAEQVHAERATNVVVFAGTTPVDQQELAGVSAALQTTSIPHLVVPLPADPAAFAARMQSVGVDAAIVLADPAEALPLARGLSAQALKTTWQPPHGVLASTQLLDTGFINDAGQITRIGGISFASDVNPFDPIDQYYARQLRQLVPGMRPTFDGMHGYMAGWLIANALSFGGGHPGPRGLSRLLSTRFTNFNVGSYRGRWTGAGGGPSQMAFFRSTFLNPMAMPVNSPGGALALAHEGTFLNAGGFEQVAPFTRLP